MRRSSVEKPSKSLRNVALKNINNPLKPMNSIVSTRKIELLSTESLDPLQSINPLMKNPVFSLRSENFKLKDSILSMNTKINEEISNKRQKSYMMIPSHSRTVLEEELEAKRKILHKFEKEWESVCQKYEDSYKSQLISGLSQQVVNFENAISSLEEKFNSDSNISETQTLMNEITNLQKAIQEQTASKEENYKKINALKANEIKKLIPRIDLKKRADSLNSDHISQMKQLKWEEQRLKQGLEATLKNEQEIQSQVDKKNAHLDKLKGQIAELNSKKI